jgi:hypothetical protein
MWQAGDDREADECDGSRHSPAAVHGTWEAEPGCAEDGIVSAAGMIGR